MAISRVKAMDETKNKKNNGRTLSPWIMAALRTSVDGQVKAQLVNIDKE